MIQYNLAAEVASFVVIVILILNLAFEKELDSRRNKFFKGIVVGMLFIVVFTLSSTYLSMNMHRYPLWLTEFFLVMYFISLPLALVMGLFYTRSLKRTRNSKRLLSAPRLFLLVPYFIYTVIVISNYAFNNVFTVSRELGYIRGSLYLIPYPIALFYVVAIFIVAFRNRRETNRGIGFVICLNVLVMAGISFSQLIFSNILLSGLANVSGLLVIYLYVQNVTKSTDRLTGLYNRDMLAYQLNRRMNIYNNLSGSSLHKDSHRFSIVAFSLRNIKGINERYGFAGGDELLEGVAKYLRTSFSPFHVYRYSGDEFAVLIDKNLDAVDDKLRNVALRFAKPFVGEDNKVEMNISIVYARVDFPDFGKDMRSLVSALDYSVSLLKHGKYRTNYMHDLTIYEKVSRRNRVVEWINSAIENDGFEVVYQAIHSTKENRFTGAEALVRMKKEFGDTYPDEFIPLAEETGLIVSMTYIVIERVCADLRRMIDTYGKVMEQYSVSINFPYAQFLENDLIGKIMHILDTYAISPKQIKIEITERTLIGDAGLIHGIMEDMQAKGFVFEVDDFGVDYSNISMILNLPVEIIKIDRSLVLLATEKQRYEEFFRLFLKAIRHTERKIIIEGIETKEQAAFFESCGSDFIQGFFYAIPLAFDKYVELLNK